MGKSRDGEPVSTTVVYEVAMRENVDPVELKPPLYDAVDPSALDELCEHHLKTGTRGVVSFEYLEYEVEIVVEDGAVETTVRDAGATRSHDCQE